MVIKIKCTTNPYVNIELGDSSSKSDNLYSFPGSELFVKNSGPQICRGRRCKFSKKNTLQILTVLEGNLKKSSEKSKLIETG